MGKEKVIIILLAFICLASLVLLADGITGMIVFDETIKAHCSDDSECNSPEVCCLFYGENAGVCHDSEMCAPISKITQGEKKEKEDFYSMIQGSPTALKHHPRLEALIGLFIGVLGTVTLIYYLTHHHDHHTKSHHIKRGAHH